jgi:phosphate transport system permease protein
VINIYTRRKAVNVINLTASMATTLFGLFFLAWLLWVLVSQGIGHLDLQVFTQNTPGPGTAGGGIKNALVGSILLTVVGVLIGTPIGIFAGTYLSEYGRAAKISPVIRFINDILLSAPSIVIGVFVYEIVVVTMGHFSGWAGSVALAIIVIPVVVRTTEDMMRLVPDHMREAAAALGAPQWKVIIKIVYKAARSGIMTGIILAVARISGETAPLLFTALNNQFWTTNMNQPMANLPVMIFDYAMSPYTNWQELAWVGALLITASVLALNIFARIFLRPHK